MAQDPNSTNDRIDQAMRGGSPKIDPDQQRKYLGTFRERVDLAVKIQDMGDSRAIKDTETEIKKHPHYTLVINGDLDDNLTAPYMKIASNTNTHFDMESNKDYFTKPDSYGVIYRTDHTAINVSPIDVFDKYPLPNKQNKTSTSKPYKKQPKKENGFMRLIHKIF